MITPEMKRQWQPVLDFIHSYIGDTGCKTMYEALTAYRIPGVPDWYESVKDITDSHKVDDKGSLTEQPIILHKEYGDHDGPLDFYWGMDVKDDGKYWFGIDIVYCPNGKLLKFD